MDRALDWVLVEGPDGTYGSFDAGLAGYRLDGIHPLVNLDGLTNDNDYVDFLADHPGRLQPARREGVDILIGPLPLRDRQGDLACSTTLWEGYPGARADGTDPTANRVWVLDLRTCR